MSSMLAVLVLFALQPAGAHIAMWNKGLFGLNYPGQANDSHQYYNSNYAIVPLRHFENLTTEQWFGRGLKAYPPAEGDFMELVSGGTFVGELSCNRAWTTLRDPNADRPLHYYACPTVGPLHVNNKFGEEPDPQYFGGTAIAIAYTSDVAALQPGDMTVISVNYTSVWTRETEYKIPCGLPPCPPGGCLCTWNWIHQDGHGEGYGKEIYNNLYRCNVSGQTSTKNQLKVAGGVPPVLCENDPEQCVQGPKQPMYVWMAEGNNMPWPDAPPSYNHRYGFRDGAQLDIFGEIDKTACQDDEVVLTQSDGSASIDTAVEESEPVQDVTGYLTTSAAHAQAPWSAGRDSVPGQQTEIQDTAKDAIRMHAEVDPDRRLDQAPMAATGSVPALQEELLDRATFPDRYMDRRYTAELR